MLRTLGIRPPNTDQFSFYMSQKVDAPA